MAHCHIRAGVNDSDAARRLGLSSMPSKSISSLVTICQAMPQGLPQQLASKPAQQQYLPKCPNSAPRTAAAVQGVDSSSGADVDTNETASYCEFYASISLRMRKAPEPATAAVPATAQHSNSSSTCNSPAQQQQQVQLPCSLQAAGKH
jgi:hypothetical protein